MKLKRAKEGKKIPPTPGFLQGVFCYTHEVVLLQPCSAQECFEI